MKRYNMIKNLMLASATATLYWGYVLEGVQLLPKVYGTFCVFLLMFILMRDADKCAIKAAKEAKERKKQDVQN